MSQTFKITSKMANVHAFNLLKDYYVQRSITLDTALDGIEHVLKSDYDMNEWMDLTYCLVMDWASWRDVEACNYCKLSPTTMIELVYGFRWCNHSIIR